LTLATQLRQMTHGGQHPTLRGSNTLLALQKRQQLQLITEPQFRTLWQGYEFLRFRENRLRLASPYGAASFSRAPKTLGKIGRLLDHRVEHRVASAQDLEHTYLRMTQNIRSAFQEIVTN